jgi:hypothetical protein
MTIECDLNLETDPTSFIGYKVFREDNFAQVTIFLNCRDEADFESAVDVIFEENEPARFDGIDGLSVIKKFNRLIGSLEERAREEKASRGQVFQSANDLIYFLSRVKNSKEFGK